MTIESHDIDAHIADYNDVVERIQNMNPSLNPGHRHELALMILQVHELHRNQHITHETRSH